VHSIPIRKKAQSFQKMVKLKPWYIVGLVEGEGCFAVSVSKHKTKRLGLDPRLMFEMELRGDEFQLLERLKFSLGCGFLYKLNYPRYGWKPHAKYAVKSHKDIFKYIIPFFKKYPLQGKKGKDFEDFCRAAEIFRKKEHLTMKGIEKLNAIRSQMNEKRPFSW